ncbi:MAG TPA: FHIPEP family type III secretion protein [Pseudomonadota bacterium]|nr:FHIPEP family type III secretion protein [Pseudomonadota bacterium]
MAEQDGLLEQPPAHRVLRSVGLPVTPQGIALVAELGPHAYRRLAELVTADVAADCLERWNHPFFAKTDGSSPEPFRRALAGGVAMGLSLERFRDSTACLPLYDEVAWTDFFESAVAGPDRCRIRIGLAPELYQRWVPESRKQGEESWSEGLKLTRDGLFYELGIRFPRIEVAPDSTLRQHQLRITWNDLWLPPHDGIADDRLMVNDTVERLFLIRVDGAEPTLNPANGSLCSTVPLSYKERCEAAELTTWNASGRAILTVSAVLRCVAFAFVNRLLVFHAMSELAVGFPALIEQCNQHLNRDHVVHVLRGLVQEGVSFRNFRAILEVMLSPRRVASASSPEDLLRVVRSSLQRQISHKYGSGRRLAVCLLGQEIEARLEQPVELSEAERHVLHEGLALYDNVSAKSPVILTRVGIRRRLYELVCGRFPQFAVLSYDEIDPDYDIQPFARLEADLRPV